MSKPSEERGIFSRLPDDPEYWDELSGKIVNAAVATLTELRDEGKEWWSILARYSTALALGASAAVVAGILIFPHDKIAEATPTSLHAYGLAPADPLAAPLLAADMPPTMGSLMVLSSVEVEE